VDGRDAVRADHDVVEPRTVIAVQVLTSESCRRAPGAQIEHLQCAALAAVVLVDVVDLERGIGRRDCRLADVRGVVDVVAEEALEQTLAAVRAQAAHVGDGRTRVEVGRRERQRVAGDDPRLRAPDDARSRRHGTPGVPAARPRLPVHRDRLDVPYRARDQGPGPCAHDHQPVIRSHVGDPPTVGRERWGASADEAADLVIARGDDHDPPLLDRRDGARIGRPGWRARHRQPGQMSRTARPQDAPAYDRKPSGGRPHGVAQPSHHGAALADRVDPIDEHVSALEEGDKCAAGLERRPERRAEGAVHARAIGVDDPDPRPGEHQCAPVGRPLRPVRRPAPDGRTQTDPPRACTVGPDEHDPAAGARLHGQQPVRTRKRRLRRGGAHQRRRHDDQTDPPERSRHAFQNGARLGKLLG
jgi:hypothetical protein